jgi:ABC-2 type transport system ATP-binding protein
MIEIEKVSFAYGKKAPLFSELDWNLTPGTIYGLLGRNGAGKTTLLKLLGGLIFRDGGTISVLGHDPEDRIPELQQEMLFIPEELPTPPMTIGTYESIYKGLYPRFDGTEFTRYLAEFELDRSAQLGEISFGQRKKALLAFGLAANTRILVLDEPTNALDIPSKGQLRRILAGAANGERVIVVSTHQVRDMEQIIDPVVILEQGKIIFDHPMERVTQALRVELGPEESEDALYSERAMGGYASIVPNRGRGDSRIDMELLFNAVTTATDKITSALAQEVQK